MLLKHNEWIIHSQEELYLPSSRTLMTIPFPVYPSFHTFITFKSTPGGPSVCPLFCYENERITQHALNMGSIL